MGFYQGLGMVESSQKRELYGSNATIGETSAGIDEIFLKPENAALLVVSAIRVFVMKVKGSLPAEVEAELAELRAIARQDAGRPAPAK